MRKLIFPLIAFFGAVGLLPVYSQESSGDPADANIENVPAEESAVPELPRGFRAYRFGETMDSVKEALIEDSYFLYRGDAEVSLLDHPNRQLIDTRGSGYIARAGFQFYEERLFLIILELNPQYIDFFTMLSSLMERYGDPGLMDPERALWRNEEFQISLEYPLTVKYIDLQTFNSIHAQTTPDDPVEQSREDFIGQLFE